MAVIPKVLKERRKICLECDHHLPGGCSMGFKINDPRGCPDGRFKPVGKFMRAKSVTRTIPKPVTAPKPCVGVNCKDDVKPISHTEAASAFGKAMIKWKRGGFATVDNAEHNRRGAICKSCEYYGHFQCSECKCITMLKTKLATESCPKNKW